MQKQEIAQQAGWVEDAPDVPIATDTGTDTDTFQIDNTTLLDAEDQVAPSSILASKPIWRHPIPRTVLVVVGVGSIGFSVIRLTAGNGFIHPNQNQVAVAPTPAPKQTPPTTDTDKTGELQAKLATISQQQQMDALKNAKQTPPPALSSSPKQPTAAVSQQSVPMATAPAPRQEVVAYQAPIRYSPLPKYSKRPLYSPRPKYSPETVVTRSRTTRPAPAFASTPALSNREIASRSFTATTQQDPYASWSKLANLGSYGSMSPVSGETASSQTDDYPPAINSVDLPSGGLGSQPTAASSMAASKAKTSNAGAGYQNVNYFPTAANNIIVGTKAAAKLETPIAWSGNLQNPNQNFLIQLTEPLKAADNSVAIPKGAYLVVRVDVAGETGLLQMSVVRALVSERGRMTERPIPNGAILVLGKSGTSLKASRERRRSAGNNLGTVVLSGISTVTGLINAPTSQSVFSSGGGFQTTTTNPKQNYLAGFGYGATQAMVQQMQTRNQQARQLAESQPTVFVLNQGTSVQVFVNQSFAF